MSEKTLDRKLANIHADPSGAKDFILADAKDADMAYGMAAPGKSPEQHADEARFRTLADYRQIIRENVRQGLVDIMLMSASTNEVLTIHERLFEGSAVTPATRANDTTDIWVAAGATYREIPARPFRSATIDHMMCGKVACTPEERRLGSNLGLYSITFNNHLRQDQGALEQYKAFRAEAETKGFRHFLEIFEPNACGDRCPTDLGRFINDQIARTLAGVTSKGRPIFLKIPYQGPAAMEELVRYDPHLVVGILGGSSGTTYDAFFQLWESRRHGARAALYGRMINNSEHQHSFIEHLRGIADGVIDDPAEAVRSYHGALQKLGIAPYRSLADDLLATLRQTAYGGTNKASATVPGRGGPAKAAPPAAPARTAGQPTANGQARAAAADGEPDFARMTPDEKVAWNLARWKRVLG